jgi:trimethylamine---corrinoid protein Co-methyltransferase
MRKIQTKLEVLSAEEIQAIHRSSLRILERTGVRVPQEEWLRRLRKAGAKVEENSGIVRIPSPMIEEMIRQIQTASQTSPPQEPPARLEGVISTQLYLVDYRTCSRRLGLLEDVLKGIALLQHLKNFPSANAVVVPSDVPPPPLAEVVSMQMIYSYSRKPGCTYVLTPFSARHVIRMAEVISQPVWFLLDPVSPLQFRQENLEIAVIFAQAGQPLYAGSMVMAGATGPVTLAGTLTLQNAELLASLFLIFMLTGSPSKRVYNSGPHSVDPATMLCSFGSPNQALLGIGMAQLGRHYGLECVANAGLTDSLLPDFQAGLEKSATAIFGLLAGLDKIGCQGLVGADQGFSFEQLALDNEWMEYCNYILEGIEVTEEAIAVDLIEQIGIGGNFLAEEHTARHCRRNSFQSIILNRQGWEAWSDAKAKDALAKASDYMESVAGNYRTPEPVCTSEQFAELTRLVELAKAEV